MKGFDFHTVIDNSVVARLVKEGFFQKLFGPASRPKRIARRSSRSSRSMASITMYRADQVGSLLRPQEVLDARKRSRHRRPSSCARSRTAHPARLERQKGSRLQDLHRRRAAPQRIHERLLRVGRGPRQRRLDRAGVERAVGRERWSAAGSLSSPGSWSARIRQKKRLTKHEVDFLRGTAPATSR